MFDAAEPAYPKPGNGGLKLFEAMSNFIGDEGIVPEGGGKGGGRSATAAEGKSSDGEPGNTISVVSMNETKVARINRFIIMSSSVSHLAVSQN